MSEEIKKGLLGIVVDETTVSHVVPELSALTYRGYTVRLLFHQQRYLISLF
jgi:2-methylcitrate synthase